MSTVTEQQAGSPGRPGAPDDAHLANGTFEAKDEHDRPARPDQTVLLFFEGPERYKRFHGDRHVRRRIKPLVWKLVRGHWKTGFHALPEGSELRETIDRLILQRIRAPAWQDLLNGYMPD